MPIRKETKIIGNDASVRATYEGTEVLNLVKIMQENGISGPIDIVLTGAEFRLEITLCSAVMKDQYRGLFTLTHTEREPTE